MPRKSIFTMAVTAAVLLAGCGGDDGGPTVVPNSVSPSTSSESSTSTAASSASSSSSSSTPSSTPSSTSSAPAELVVGDCLMYSTYEKVDCSRPHDMEVSALVPNKEYANDLVKRNALRSYTCLTEAAKYTGGPGYGTRFLSQGISASKDPKSAERIACVVMLYNETDTGIEKVSRSVKNAVKTDGFEKYQLCTSLPPSGDKVKMVPCSQPHVAESIGGFITGKFGDAYPGLDKHNANMLKQCRPYAQRYLGAQRRDIVASQNSSPASGWKRGQPITACFVETVGGVKVTKSMKGIGNKPLGSLK